MPPTPHDSPRVRRLRSDLAALERLRDESSIFAFRASGGQPPQQYQIAFHGTSLGRDRGKVSYRTHHEVEIKLGAAYPRTIPEIRWLTPIYHPNISEVGIVCLGAYGTHWVPSLALDELCTMLWDMARYQNYDIRSPYNREAAQWASVQTNIAFPTDARPLRDGRAALGRIESAPAHATPTPAPGDAEPFQLLDLEVDPRRAVDPLRQSNALDTDASTRRPVPTPSPSPPPPPVDEVVFLE